MFYLRLKSIPELADLSRSERTMAWHTCRKRVRYRWKTLAGALAGLLIGTGLGIGALNLVLILSPAQVSRPGRMATYLIAGFACGAIIMASMEAARWIAISAQIRPFLREHLGQSASPASPGNQIENKTENKNKNKTEIDYLEEPFEETSDSDRAS